MKKILMFILMISAGQVLADINSCGKYKIEGKIERVENQFYLVLNQGSASEIKLLVNRNDLPMIVPYLDKSFKATIQVLNYKNQKVEEFKIIEIDRNIEHEMSPNIKDTATKEVSEDCKKE